MDHDDDPTRPLRRDEYERAAREDALPFRPGRFLAPDGAVIEVRECNRGSWVWTSVIGERLSGGTVTRRLWEALVPIPESIDVTAQH